MKVIISDYAVSMMEDHDYEFKILKQDHPDWTIKSITYDPENLTKFNTELFDADALITAFIPVNSQLFDKAPKLKLVSINAMGFDKVDLKSAAEHGVRVCAVSDYCSEDVAEFTLSLMLSLTKQLKAYSKILSSDHLWKYSALPAQKRLSKQTLGIFGLGKIGQKVARMAKGFGMKILAYDPYLPPEIAANLGVTPASATQIYKEADIVTNHMRLTANNRYFFNKDAFNQMGQGQRPFFINVARGESVDENALLQALDKSLIKGAGLDVLSSENPDLENQPLLKFPNVILTPHTAFYSINSIAELQRISCQNVINFFEKKFECITNFIDERQEVTK
ncbi:NAD(P)-dependent oxidoreductase [Liquorilactobacillus oeni]|uniref:Dehydrogenase n=1 Tax=Liquorilactobacillus oeni DSM 19972 TaxID=1423777 RepID=A0A0R1MKR5_9LACO|nr:NAD(P)-dependent oxidoreductase [Liquorilactobacillus oeni]KRL05818.1 dehydrogenase [Liquorilactobacillus oeni DSM 19972]